MCMHHNAIVQHHACAVYIIKMPLVSFPDPTSREEKFGELWPNPQFMFCGVHQQGHAKLGFGCVCDRQLDNAWI